MQNGIEIPDGSKKIAVLYEDGHLTEAVKTAEKLRSEGMIASLYIKPKKTASFWQIRDMAMLGFYNVRTGRRSQLLGIKGKELWHKIRNPDCVPQPFYCIVHFIVSCIYRVLSEWHSEAL